MSASSGTQSPDQGRSDDLYRIILAAGGVLLYEWDDGIWELESLDGNETLAPISDSDRYVLSERKLSFVEVKVLAPTADPADAADRYVVVDSYYTDLQGVRIDRSGGDSDDDDDLRGDDLGSDDDDLCEGDDRDNRISGRGGNDLIKGYGGSDHLFGGDDDDDLDGGDDDDDVNGDDGDDVLTGGRGRDRLNGGRGDDVFRGGDDAGDDHYIGGAGVDAISYAGAAAGVIVNLQTGKARSSGAADAAGIGMDRLQSVENANGGAWDDDLVGSPQANVLAGDDGDDRLNGLRGVDTCSGGLGADHFIVAKASDTGLGRFADLITDFSSAEGDRIDLSAIDAKKGFGRNDAFVFVDEAPGRSGPDCLGVLWFADGYLMASTDRDPAAEFALSVHFKDPGVSSLGAADIIL